MRNRKRVESRTGIYHVMSKGINRENIFNQNREKEYFLKIIEKNLKKYDGIEIYAYCVMSNHFHILLKADFEKMSYFMAIILAEYAEYYNYKHYRNGHVFQGRFSSECVEDESYFWSCIRYIHLNPVKSSMVMGVEQYVYSSYKKYIVYFKNAQLNNQMLEEHSDNQEILSRKSYKMLDKKFAKVEDFKKFHAKNIRQLIMDISDDLWLQKIEIALEIAMSYLEKYGLADECEVFENKELRERYKKELQVFLKLSQKQTDKLYMTSKGKIQTKEKARISRRKRTKKG